MGYSYPFEIPVLGRKIPLALFFEVTLFITLFSAPFFPQIFLFHDIENDDIC